MEENIDALVATYNDERMKTNSGFIKRTPLVERYFAASDRHERRANPCKVYSQSDNEALELKSSLESDLLIAKAAENLIFKFSREEEHKLFGKIGVGRYFGDGQYCSIAISLYIGGHEIGRGLYKTMADLCEGAAHLTCFEESVFEERVKQFKSGEK